MESYFESVEKYHAFILKRFEQQIQFDDQFQYQGLNEKLKNHLNNIETQDLVLSDMYSFLKGDGLDLDVEFKWEEPELYMTYLPMLEMFNDKNKNQHYFRTLEEDGVEWDCQKDREHYWRLLEFSKLHQFDNLTDHCYLKLYSV